MLVLNEMLYVCRLRHTYGSVPGISKEP